MRGLLTLALIGLVGSVVEAQTFLGAFEDKNYFITDRAGTIDDARNVAASMGPGHFVTSIHSLAEQEFVFSVVQPYNKVWIGLNDEAVKGNYVWEDGTAFDYANWADGQPAGKADDHWVYMDATDGGGWKVTEHDGALFIVPIHGVISAPVPEPASLAILGLGLAALGARRRKTALRR